MEEPLPDFSDVLSKYMDADFASLIPKTMLHLSDEERSSIEYAFWFCHIVERDLADVLTVAITLVNEARGPIPAKLSSWVLEKYGLKMEKTDPSQPEFDIKNITFGDRIFFSEKLRGKSAHTKFLWKIKNLRDELSHGRTENLSYEGESIFDKQVKAKMLTDYITLMNGIGDEPEGGFIATLSEKERGEIQQEFEKLKAKLDS